jgi:hypothetical protein
VISRCDGFIDLANGSRINLNIEAVERVICPLYCGHGLFASCSKGGRPGPRSHL